MALELHGADERLSGIRRTMMLALLLLAACPPPPATPSGEQQPAPTPTPTPVSEQPEAPRDKPSPPATSTDPQRVIFPAKPACPGGLEIPAFDPASAPWWDQLTRDQRDAFIRSGAYKHWSAVTESPIVLHRAKTGLVLRSVDGCWRQELSTERITNDLPIDGLAGVAWQWHPQGLRLLDLWNPGPLVPILAEPVAAEDLAIVDSVGSVLLQWSDRTEGTDRPAQAKLKWNAVPTLIPARPAGPTPSLTPEGSRWLGEHLDRQAPGPRTTRLALFSQSELPAESRCKDPSVCRKAAPFGASNLELVYYGEFEDPPTEDAGPLCALFDPSSGAWYKDVTRTVKAPDPRQFDAHETECRKWVFDVTGRAYLHDGQVCVSTQCLRAEGEPLGFVRGNIFITI